MEFIVTLLIASLMIFCIVGIGVAIAVLLLILIMSVTEEFFND